MISKGIIINTLTKNQQLSIAMMINTLKVNSNIMVNHNNLKARVYAEMDMLSDDIMIDIDLSNLDELLFTNVMSKRNCFNTFVN